MEVLTQTEIIALLDSLACALLAAAASAKARACGAHFTGAAVLGCICGMLGPLLREIALHGERGGRLVISLLPDDALLGSLAGIAAILLARNLPVAFWLDALSVSLAATLGCVLTLQDNGIAAGLCLGLVCAFLPGVTRDVSLGDMAEIVESEWYVASAAIGCATAIMVFILPFFVQAMSFLENCLLQLSVIVGTLIAFGLQLFKRAKF